MSMSEAEAWRFLAERFVQPKGNNRYNGAGLCNGVDVLYENYKITRSTRWEMVKRLEFYLGARDWAYSVVSPSLSYASRVGDTSKEAHEARAMAALYMALDAEDEPK